MDDDEFTKEIYSLMQKTHRVYSGHSDHWTELASIADDLSRKSSDRKKEEILIGGWHLDEEKHGGYENSEGKREILGEGFRIFKGIVSKNEKKEGPQKIVTSIEVEVWKQTGRTIFIAFRTQQKIGYVGIDNHYGTDTAWSVVGLRVVKVKND